MKSIGRRIKARRNELGLSQRDLADRMSYNSHTSIAKIEGGEVDLPISKVHEFADVLGVPVRWLIGLDSHADELTEVYEGHDSYLAMMSDKTTAQLYHDFLQLHMTKDELTELYKYAQFLVSRR